MRRCSALASVLALFLIVNGGVLIGDTRILITDEQYRNLVEAAGSCRLDRDVISSVRLQIRDEGGETPSPVDIRMHLELAVTGATPRLVPIMAPSPYRVVSAESSRGPVLVRRDETGSLFALLSGPGVTRLSLQLAAPLADPASGLRSVSLVLPRAASVQLELDLPRDTVLLANGDLNETTSSNRYRRRWIGTGRPGEVFAPVWGTKLSGVPEQAVLRIRSSSEGFEGRLEVTPSKLNGGPIRLVLPQNCTIEAETPVRSIVVDSVIRVEAEERDSPIVFRVEWPREVVSSDDIDPTVRLPLPRVEGVPLSVTMDASEEGSRPLSDFLDVSGGVLQAAPVERDDGRVELLIADGPAHLSFVSCVGKRIPSFPPASVRRVQAACFIGDGVAPLVHVRLLVDNVLDDVVLVRDVDPADLIQVWSAGSVVTPLTSPDGKAGVSVPLTFFGTVDRPAAGLIDLYYRGRGGARPSFPLAGARDVVRRGSSAEMARPGVFESLSSGFADGLQFDHPEAIVVDLVSETSFVSSVVASAGSYAEPRSMPQDETVTEPVGHLRGPMTPTSSGNPVHRWIVVPSPLVPDEGPLVVSLSLTGKSHRRLGAVLLFIAGVLMVGVIVFPGEGRALRSFLVAVVSLVAGIVIAPPFDVGSAVTILAGVVVSCLLVVIVWASSPDSVSGRM